MSLLHWFERQASNSPDATAIVFEKRRVTYGELRLLVSRIAAGLRQAGVENGGLVGILLDRRPEMIAVLLGVWQAGCAWLPLDPALPSQRIAFMLQDAAPFLVVTQRHLVHHLGPKAGRVLDLDDILAGQSMADQAGSSATGGEDETLAYVMYTSGSTGKPKGVTITHAGLANTIAGVGKDLLFTADDCVLASATIGFDVACLEIFLPLVSGASVLLVDTDFAAGWSVDGTMNDPLRSPRLTALFGTPTMFHLLLESGWAGDPRMQVIVGGEVLPISLARQLAARCRVLWNQYGPTETSICATRARIDGETDRVTIGTPLPNVSIFLLDKDLDPVAPGLVGEIFIGGPGVARGYVNRPDLMEKRFLQLPCAGDGNVRVYRTGDLARRLSDGRLDFLGRADEQVKLRGFRIELGEIESVLAQCDGIQGAIVRVVALQPHDRRLVAFVVGDSQGREERWRQTLIQHLPVYMLPSAYIALKRFPSTPNGKVDLQALDAMFLQATGTDPFLPSRPASSIEGRLAAIWSNLLQISNIANCDDFFTLGGHSLLATRMLAQVEASFGYKLPHAVLVEHPTIEGLAAYLRGAAAPSSGLLIPLRAGTQRPPLFIAHGIGGSILSLVELATHLRQPRPVYALQLPASIEPWQGEFKTLAAGYIKQMRSVWPSGPYHLAGHSSGGIMAFEIACQLSEQGESVGLLALIDCYPQTVKPGYRSWSHQGALKMSFQRARFRVGQVGVRGLLQRRLTYHRMEMRIWLAARLRRNHRAASLKNTEGQIALALRETELRPYAGSATLFVAREEPASAMDPAKAWTGLVLGACEMRPVEGSHMSILYLPHVVALAQEIDQCLQKSEQTLVTGELFKQAN